MQIPFINLSRQYESIRSEIDQAIQFVFEQAQFIGGSTVKKFESDFANRYSVPHCLSTGNGTDALFLILKALNIKHGDEVITPAFSCIPSSETISLVGATPVFCDVDPIYYTLNPDEVVKKITSKTKAIIAVHLFGQSADGIELKKICDANSLFLIEDCAQAHLSSQTNKLAGTFGVASAFSFYPTKNLGAYGDAGCILTHDDGLAEKMRRLANHGALAKDDHLMEGTNSRMDSLQAALLSVKLNHLEKWNSKRKEIAALYNSLLADINNLTLPAEKENTNHTFHIFSIQTASRDSLKNYLGECGIETMIHYPKGLPFTEAYKHFQHSEKEFPVTAKLQQQVLSLPVYAELTNEEVIFVAESIRQFFSTQKKSPTG